MRSRCVWRYLASLLIALPLAAMSGCDEELSSWTGTAHSRFERMAAHQIAVDASDTLDVVTRFGSVTVTGSERADCDIVARIVAEAPTEEEAQALAEQVEIVGESAGSILKIRSREPDLTDNRSIRVSYTIAIPRRMNVQCDSRYGSLELSGIEGSVTGKSDNGSIKIQDVRGQTDLSTSYGSVECRNVVGKSIRLHSNNGSITMANLRGSTTAQTSYGAIACEDFADGDLKLHSGNGRIEVSDAKFGLCEAESSYGAIAANRLEGDSINLDSGNGSVELGEARAKRLDVSSSYGRIRATGIAAQDVKAISGHGTVSVACAPDAPANLNAQAKSSYGSVEFTAPAGFAGEVSLSTGFGSVQTTLPVTVSGELNRSRVSGKVGDGAGKIHIESSNGSVELK